MKIAEPRCELDRTKLLEAVHFVCANCRPEELGNVKLHKVLYFSDMLHFLSTGKPLTGVEYQKQQFGPVARHLSWAVNHLASQGKLIIKKRDYFGFQKVDYIVAAPPQSRALSNHAVQILSDVIDFVCARSAREISELSHNAAWEAAAIGEVIPYYSALGMFPSAVTDADLLAAAEEAERVAPFVEREYAASGVR